MNNLTYKEALLLRDIRVERKNKEAEAQSKAPDGGLGMALNTLKDNL